MNERDRIRSAVTEGFSFSEARHAPSTSLLPHSHEHASLNVLLNGTFDEHYRYAFESCQPFSLLFRPVGVKHANHFGRNGAHILSIEIEKSRLDNVDHCKSWLSDVWQWRDPRVTVIVKRMRCELKMRDTAAKLALESLALELLALVTRRFSSADQNKPTPKWLHVVREVLHDRFKERLTVRDLSSLGNVHPIYLVRAFRAAYGYTPGEYLRQLRVEWALRQLTESERPLSEIAQDAGFYDQSHFTRSFKVAVGWTPAAFRRQSGSEVESERDLDSQTPARS